MSEKQLGLREQIRYFFAGLVVVTGGIVFCITNGDIDERLAQINKWFETNRWVRDFPQLVAIMVPALILGVGFGTYFLYRLIVYKCVILPFKKCGALALGAKWEPFSYRELLQKWVKTEHNRDIGMWEAEHLYKHIRTKLEFKYWNDQATQLTSGVHLFYITSFVFSVVLLCSSQWSCGAAGILALIVVIAFLVAFVTDILFEREELSHFLAEESKIKEEIAKLHKHP